MKKIFFFIFIYSNVLACDICNMNVSLMPEDNKNTFSLLYRSRLTEGSYTMLGTVPVTGTSRHAGPSSEVTVHYGKRVKEVYNVYDLRGVYYLNKKLSLTGSLPIINNIKYMDDEKSFDFVELGDPMIIGNYNLVNTKLTPGLKFNHKLNVGLGFKLPLGKSNVIINNELVEPDMQPGTGSLDFVFTSDYIFTIKNFGLLNNINYKFNTVNKDNQYKYGSSWNHTLILFYLKKMGNNVSVMPNAGFYYEYANTDKFNDNFIPQSGGMVTFGTFGLNFYFKKIRLEASYQEALHNSMNGNTQIPTKNRVIVGMSYYFN